MSNDYKPLFSGFSPEINVKAIDICFSLSAIENMVKNILEILGSSTDLYDPQTAENLKQVARCLLQTRGCVNNRFKDTKPWLDTKISAKFESRMVIHGVEGLGQDLFHAFDISDALSHTTGGVTMFLGMEPTICEPEFPDPDYYEDEPYEEYYEEPPKPKKRKRGRQAKFRGGDFKCTKCEATFEKEEYLKQHEELFVHDKYKCEQCDKLFSWKKGFDEHMSSVHGVKASSDSAAKNTVSKLEPQNEANADQNTITCKQEVVESAELREAKPRVSTDYDGGNTQTVSGVGGDEPANESSIVKQEATGGGYESQAGGGGSYEKEAGEGDGYEKEAEEGGDGVEGENWDALDEDGENLDFENMFTEIVKSEAIGYEDDENGEGSPSNPMVQCNICQKTMLKSSSFQHKKKHTGERPYSCEECGKSFIRHDNMKKHMLIHGPREKIYCINCNKGFYNQASMEKHMARGDCTMDDFIDDGSRKRKRKVKSENKSWPPKPKKKYFQANPLRECDICGKQVKRSNLHMHLRIHTGERPFPCTECSKRFISKYNLKKHIYTTHTPNREKMLCQNCGAGFLTLPALKKHSCEKTRMANQKLDCKICGKVVKSDVNMRSHMKIHSKERPYTCEVCGECFRRPYEINIHRIRAHEKPTCDICASSFTSISSLNRHKQCVHSDLRPFSCDVCGKDYKDKGSLMKHRVIHNKDENIKFKCEMCPKIFYFLKDLRRHYQKVHNIDITADEELDRRHADAGRQAIRAALSRAEFGGHDHRMLSN